MPILISGDPANVERWREALEQHFGDITPVLIVTDRIGPTDVLRGAYILRPGVGPGNYGEIQDFSAEVRQCLQQAGLL